MALLILPPPTTPDTEYSIDLDGSTYILRFRWHERPLCWHLDLLDVDGLPIKMGMRLVLNHPLIGDLVHAQRPPGDFYLDDATGLGTDPVYEDIGSRVTMYYLESGTTEETLFS